MSSLIQTDKTTCDNFGTQTTTNNIVRHNTGFSVETLSCTQCLNSSIKSKSDLNSHFAKKSTAPQNLTLYSNVYFVINRFQDLTLYVNIKTLKMAFLIRQQTLIGTISSTEMLMLILKRSCTHVETFPRRFRT